MKQFVYLAFWFFKTRFLGKKIPLQSVLFISDECNLSCKHCSVYNTEHPQRKTAEMIYEELLYSYQLGARFVDFEGGEPFLWQDGEKTVNDLIMMAKNIGFFSTTVTTNAQLPFSGCLADSIWVSLDGLEKHHENIRGEGTFSRLLENIEQANHKALNVNMVINSQNYKSVRETIQFVADHHAFKSISLNFYTPSLSPDSFFLSWDKRNQVIDEIISMKKAGYPIINSISGLKYMRTNKFKNQCWITNFILPDGSRYLSCPIGILGECTYCGYCMAGEMASVFNLKPETILSALKLRSGLGSK